MAWPALIWDSFFKIDAKLTRNILTSSAFWIIVSFSSSLTILFKLFSLWFVLLTLSVGTYRFLCSPGKMATCGIPVSLSSGNSDPPCQCSFHVFIIYIVHVVAEIIYSGVLLFYLSGRYNFSWLWFEVALDNESRFKSANVKLLSFFTLLLLSAPLHGGTIPIF